LKHPVNRIKNRVLSLLVGHEEFFSHKNLQFYFQLQPNVVSRAKKFGFAKKEKKIRCYVSKQTLILTVYKLRVIAHR